MADNKEINDILESEARVDAFCDALEKILADEVQGQVEKLTQAKSEDEASQILATIAALPKSVTIQGKITEIVGLYTAELEALAKKFPITEADANTAINMSNTHIELVTSILQESVNTIVSQLTLEGVTQSESEA